jgi:hypothetical protein
MTDDLRDHVRSTEGNIVEIGPTSLETFNATGPIILTAGPSDGVYLYAGAPEATDDASGISGNIEIVAANSEAGQMGAGVYVESGQQDAPGAVRVFTKGGTGNQGDVLTADGQNGSEWLPGGGGSGGGGFSDTALTDYTATGPINITATQTDPSDSDTAMVTITAGEHGSLYLYAGNGASDPDGDGYPGEFQASAGRATNGSQGNDATISAGDGDYAAGRSGGDAVLRGGGGAYDTGLPYRNGAQVRARGGGWPEDADGAVDISTKGSNGALGDVLHSDGFHTEWKRALPLIATGDMAYALAESDLAGGAVMNVDLGATPPAVGSVRVVGVPGPPFGRGNVYFSTDNVQWQVAASNITTADSGIIPVGTPITARYWQANGYSSVSQFSLLTPFSIVRLPIGAEGQTLKVVGGVPKWA